VTDDRLGSARPPVSSPLRRLVLLARPLPSRTVLPLQPSPLHSPVRLLSLAPDAPAYSIYPLHSESLIVDLRPRCLPPRVCHHLCADSLYALLQHSIAPSAATSNVARCSRPPPSLYRPLLLGLRQACVCCARRALWFRSPVACYYASSLLPPFCFVTFPPVMPAGILHYSPTILPTAPFHLPFPQLPNPVGSPAPLANSNHVSSLPTNVASLPLIGGTNYQVLSICHAAASSHLPFSQLLDPVGFHAPPSNVPDTPPASPLPLVVQGVSPSHFLQGSPFFFPTRFRL